MRKAVMISLGGGLTVAVAVAGVWLWAYTRDDVTSVNSAGGSIALDSGSTGQIDVNNSTNIPLSDSAGGEKRENEEDLTQYDKYKSEQSVLYGEIQAGTGAQVVAGSKVSVHYVGRLTNGKTFDETVSKGLPYHFTVGEHKVISGFEQGLLGMKAGGKRRLVIPPAAGYGDQAVGFIPANSLLVFDVELVEVK